LEKYESNKHVGNTIYPEKKQVHVIGCFPSSNTPMPYIFFTEIDQDTVREVKIMLVIPGVK
jgi:hypothetical protein